VGKRVSALNKKFVESYTEFRYPSRSEGENVVPREEEVHSGDFFGVVRMDGLDPMLAW
jgi:hypothetical protein